MGGRCRLHACQAAGLQLCWSSLSQATTHQAPPGLPWPRSSLPEEPAPCLGCCRCLQGLPPPPGRSGHSLGVHPLLISSWPPGCVCVQAHDLEPVPGHRNALKAISQSAPTPSHPIPKSSVIPQSSPKGVLWEEELVPLSLAGWAPDPRLQLEPPPGFSHHACHFGAPFAQSLRIMGGYCCIFWFLKYTFFFFIVLKYTSQEFPLQLSGYQTQLASMRT